MWLLCGIPDGTLDVMNLIRVGVRPAPLVWLVVTGMACTSAYGQDRPELTLAAAIAEAQEKNPEIRTLDADVASMRGDVVVARTWELPELTLQPGMRRTRASDGLTTTEFDGILELRQPIEFPGKRRLRRALAEKDVELRQLALAAFRAQLTIEVRHAFMELIARGQVQNLREQSLHLAMGFVDAARKKFEGGFASEFEVTKAEVEVLSAQRALRTAQSQTTSTRIALNGLLGRKANVDFTPVGTLDTTVTLPPQDDLLQRVFARNPELKIRGAEIDRARLNLQSISKSRLPDFSVGPSIEHLKDEQTYGAGFTLPLPLWNSKKGEIISATAERDRAMAELERLKQDVARDVATAYQSLVSTKESVALFTPDLMAKVKGALDTTTRDYAEGRTNLLTYLEAQRTYFDTQADYFDTLQELNDAQAALETAVGVPFSDLGKPVDEQDNTR